MSSDSRRDPEQEPVTADFGSFEDKRARKLVCGVEATPAQRLAWLEQALRIALLTGALPRRRPPAG